MEGEEDESTDKRALSGTTAAGFAADTAELPGCGRLRTGSGRGAGYAADPAKLPGCGRLCAAGLAAADSAYRHPARSAGHALLSGPIFPCGGAGGFFKCQRRLPAGGKQSGVR